MNFDMNIDIKNEMSNDMRNGMIPNWLNAGNLGGYATRVGANPVNANISHNVDNSESTRSDVNSVSSVESASKFLTLNDVC